MKYKHRADLDLAKWLDDLCDEKIEKKASSNDVFVPYGGQERATQLHSDIVDSLLVEEKQDDEMAEMEKKIEEAKTPEELKKIEEELEGKVDKAEDAAKEKQETPAEPKEEVKEEKPEESKPAEEKPAEDEPDVDNIKKEVDLLKEEVDELNGEEKMQREIDILRKRLDNISVQDDPDLNDSIFQESSLKQAGKITIELKNPKDAKSKRVQKIIEKHVNDGGKFKDITINYDFFAPPNVIKSVRGELQKYYNRLVFERDKKNRASMLSDIRYARRLVRRIKEANPAVQQMIRKQLRDRVETLKAASLDKESGMKPTPNGKVLHKDLSNLLKG